VDRRAARAHTRTSARQQRLHLGVSCTPVLRDVHQPSVQQKALSHLLPRQWVSVLRMKARQDLKNGLVSQASDLAASEELATATQPSLDGLGTGAQTVEHIGDDLVSLALVRIRTSNMVAMVSLSRPV